MCNPLISLQNAEKNCLYENHSKPLSANVGGVVLKISQDGKGLKKKFYTRGVQSVDSHLLLSQSSDRLFLKHTRHFAETIVREISAFQYSNAELLYNGKHRYNYCVFITCEMYGYTAAPMKFIELSWNVKWYAGAEDVSVHMLTDLRSSVNSVLQQVYKI